ncbi:hypothetical protein VPHD479_0282 [Vibrio phage D479]
MRGYGFKIEHNKMAMMPEVYTATFDHFDEDGEDVEMSMTFNTLSEVRMFLAGYKIATSRVTGMPI